MDNDTLVTKFSPIVDERFYTESKSGLVTNQNFDWIGAKTVKVYSVETVDSVPYGRNTAGTSRYGTPANIGAIAQEMSLTQDNGFTFTIDKMDEDETAGVLNAGSALARQLREKEMPKIDTYTFLKMAANAGNSATGTFTSESAYADILEGTETLDEAEVQAEGRVLLCPSATYTNIKKSSDIVLETEIGQDMRIRGVVANLDGMYIQKLPSKYFPKGLNFMIAHPIATPRPVKLAEYKVHTKPQGVSGTLVEGRIVFDAFVLDNKADAIYTHFISGYSA